MRTLRWTIACLTVLATAARAQDVTTYGGPTGAALPRWMQQELARDSNAFDFARALKGKLYDARNVRAKLRDLSRVNPDTMTRERAAFIGAAVGGRLTLPVIPILFENTAKEPYSHTQLQQTLFGTAAGQLSLTTLYREMSRNVFEVRGRVSPWVRVSRPDTYYEGNDNGEPPYLGQLLKEALDKADATIDFAQYDRNQDGYVDVVAFVHPETGGECGTLPDGTPNRNIWSMRWQFGAALGPGAAYRTNDGVVVSDFVIQPAISCDQESPIAIGVFAHELGHAIGLPDLYSTTRPTAANAGVHFWSLMGSGNWNRPASPAHMDAWSKSELGWIPIVTVTRDTTIVLDAASTVGAAVRIDVPGSPGEYYLLENRQRAGSDRHLLGTGLLVWHVDSGTVASRRLSNTVQNTTARKGIDLVEADEGDLDSNVGEADDGDPFPGAQGLAMFSSLTHRGGGAYGVQQYDLRIRNILESQGRISFEVLVPPTIVASGAGEPAAAAHGPQSAAAADVSGPQRETMPGRSSTVGRGEREQTADTVRKVRKDSAAGSGADTVRRARPDTPVARLDTVRHAPPDTTRYGPSAVIKFVGPIEDRDLQWLRDQGFRVDTVFRETATVAVRLPAEYDRNPFLANRRIVLFEVRQRL